MDSETPENGSLSLTPQQADKMQPENVLHICLRHRWTILLSTLLFLIAAGIYLVKAAPIYTSSSRLYVEQNGPRIINDYEGFMTGANNYLYTQGELIRSMPIISEVAQLDWIGGLKTELRNAELELNNLMYHCTEDHPSIHAMNNRIERINKELKEQAREYADAFIEVMR